ncbi:hypothetical protein C2G38_2224275 [Gigaspora rosea]|uniref:Uncharacterized protein n=1 Tax=Gigaspora rosea TaxID=44941 RepID=A0A397U0I9_9GLOM|nr:hypothetical protein C2G38_2224275 [Gigaspora rosea]
MLQSHSNKVNESSWAHYVLQPIVNFIVDFKESDICIRWDTIINKASLERNNEKELIKKTIYMEKDALDFVINNYAKSHNYDLVKMQEIKELEKDIYNNKEEEECEEISSKIFAFIPTYNTSQSSIN